MSGDIMYDTLREELAEMIAEKECGPLLIRLSWHDAGTFCAQTNTGGARGVMQFPGSMESRDKANAGLDKAIEILAPFKKKYPQVSCADLWSLAAVIAIKVMNGPAVPWRAGREDAKDMADSVEPGRLPNAEKGCSHLRRIFGRMKFSDGEIVALSGAHTVGSTHVDRSGYSGTWTTNPLTFDNGFYKVLLSNQWMPTPGKGGCTIFKPVDNMESHISMLPSDIALLEDPKMKIWVEKYAKDEELFFSDFTSAFVKLQELSLNK